MWVISSQFNNFFHMTISELDETFGTLLVYRFVLPGKVSASFTLWLPGYLYMITLSLLNDQHDFVMAIVYKQP